MAGCAPRTAATVVSLPARRPFPAALFVFCGSVVLIPASVPVASPVPGIVQGGGLAPAFPELGEAAALTRKTARLAVPFFRVRKRKLCAISDLPRCCVPCTLLHGGCAENLRFRLPTSRSRRLSCADVGSAEPRSGSHSRLRLHAMREHCAGRQRLDELCRCTVRNRSALLRVFSRLTASRRAAASKRSRGKTSAGTRSLADAVAVGLLRSGHLMNSVTLFTGVAPGRCRELFSANGPSRAVS